MTHFSLQEVHFKFSPFHQHWYAHGEDHKFLRIVGTKYQVVDQETLDKEQTEREAKLAARSIKVKSSGKNDGKGKGGGKGGKGGKGKSGGKGTSAFGT